MAGVQCKQFWVRVMLCAAGWLAITPTRSHTVERSARTTCCYVLVCFLVFPVLLLTDAPVVYSFITGAIVIVVLPLGTFNLMAEVISSVFCHRRHGPRVFALFNDAKATGKAAPWPTRACLGLLTCLYAGVTMHTNSAFLRHVIEERRNGMLVTIYLRQILCNFRRFLQTTFVQVAVFRIYNGLCTLTESLEMTALGTHGQWTTRNRRYIIIKLRRRYARLYATVSNFNTVFGWRILLIYMECFVRMLATCTVYLLEVGSADFFTGLMFPFLGIAIQIMSCDITSAAGENFIEKIEDLLDTLPWDGLRQDMEDLLLYVKSHRINFTAGGLFRLNKRVFFAFFSAVTSYLIVTVQMC